MKRESRAPLIFAIVLLLLPVLYVVSYLALVRPTAFYSSVGGHPYRMGGEYAERVFWPLEQADRRVRPNSWLAEAKESLAH
ncbi:hypothetical protein [Anatilimnocola floriformis]|uniref:hypothetical protein n=1 Tax=Anatilimnocola floriformis TaxID=2948575 RepID=UPI0020C2EBCB|nr:hypothetical protein [Anatilimnocola floriformis]